MRKIRVLHFTKVINRNDFIDVIIRNADRDHFEMLASSYRGHAHIEDPKYDQDKIPFFSVDIDHGWIDMFRGAWRLSKILKRERIDILHTHHYYEAIIGRMACFLSTQTSHVVGRHYHDQFYLTTKGIKLKFYLFVEYIVSRMSSVVIVPSSLIVELLIKQGINSEKINLIPYCFDFNAKRYQPLSVNEIEQKKRDLGWSNKFVVGNIGRHHIIKGQTHLLEAFQQISQKTSNSILVMIGDGPTHLQLVDEAKRLNLLNDVVFLGWRKDAHELINCMDVVVHPTLQEAFPQLMIETMALAKPLIITPVSGATDVVQDHINGYLIPFRDSKSIVNIVEEIYSDREKAKVVSQNGFEFVRQNFTIQRIIPQFEQVYKSVFSKTNE